MEKYIYIHKNRQRQTDRQTDRDRERGREKERLTAALAVEEMPSTRPFRSVS